MKLNNIFFEVEWLTNEKFRHKLSKLSSDPEFVLHYLNSLYFQSVSSFTSIWILFINKWMFENQVNVLNPLISPCMCTFCASGRAPKTISKSTRRRPLSCIKESKLVLRHSDWRKSKRVMQIFLNTAVFYHTKTALLRSHLRRTGSFFLIFLQFIIL